MGTEEQANMGKQGGEIRALQEGGCVHRGGEMGCGWCYWGAVNYGPARIGPSVGAVGRIDCATKSY